MPEEPLNLVFIVADTFRADYLGCSGNDRIRTPHLDKLAEEGVYFKNAYADGLPTIPARRVFFTGNSIIPREVHGGWCPLNPDDVTLPQVLKKAGYTTGFITDTYHYFKATMNFHADFDEWQWIRGQENDKWRSGPRDAVDPRKHMSEHLWSPGKETTRGFESYDERMRQYLMNSQDVKSDEDYYCARSFLAASKWVEQNMDSGPFMLLVDTFDPHEPWDAPEGFKQMYYGKFPCERFLFGYGVDIRDIKPEDHDLLRALYAAEVTFVDMWIGRFLSSLEELGLKENTVVVFSSDHGTHLGEEGLFQKQSRLLNSCVTNVPLLVRYPDTSFAGKKIDALVSHKDYMPSFLDMLDIEDQPDMDGKSFFPLIKGEEDSTNSHVVIEMGPFIAVRTPEWYYFQHKSGDDPGNGPCLYNAKEDQKGLNNVIDKHPDVVPTMRKYIEEQMGRDIPEAGITPGDRE
jgi:arylsulfatase A-like enzyme